MQHACIENLINFLSVEKRSSRTSDDSIKVNIKETGYGGVDWIQLAQDTFQWRCFVDAVTRSQVPLRRISRMSISFLNSLHSMV